MKVLFYVLDSLFSKSFWTCDFSRNYSDALFPKSIRIYDCVLDVGTWLYI